MVVFAVEPMRFPGQLVLGILSQEACQTECEYDRLPLSCTKLYLHASNVMQAGQFSQHSDQATGWTTEELRYHFLWGQSIFLFSRDHPDQLWGPPSIIFSGYQGLFPSSAQFKYEGNYTDTHLYAFMVCTGTFLLYDLPPYSKHCMI